MPLPGCGRKTGIVLMAKRTIDGMVLVGADNTVSCVAYMDYVKEGEENGN